MTPNLVCRLVCHLVRSSRQKQPNLGRANQVQLPSWALAILVAPLAYQRYDRISILKSSSFQLHLAYSSHFRMSQINTAALSPSTPAPMSYAEKQAYRRDVLKLPGPVDRWLTSNRRSPWIAFQRDYMLLPDIQSSHVVCFIASVAKKVSN